MPDRLPLLAPAGPFHAPAAGPIEGVLRAVVDAREDQNLADLGDPREIDEQVLSAAVRA